MIDTHCHIYSEYYSDIDKLVSLLKSSGINKVIVNGCDMKTNLEVLQLVKKYDIVYGAIGFHPTELDEYNSSDMEWLEKNITSEKIVAIGEIGLDYHYENTDKNKQKDVFKKQLNIAKKYNKRVIIHARDSIQDVYDILRQYNVRGSMHCYSGSLEMAKEFIKLGFYLGIGGVCTYKNAKNIVNVIENIDIAYILLETDSPYLSPEPKRGEKNTPINIKLIAEKVGCIKKIPINDVVDITSKNAKRLFDF